MKMVAFRSSI